IYYYLLPFLEQDNLYKLGVPTNGSGPYLNVFACPSDASDIDATLAFASYAANPSVFGYTPAGALAATVTAPGSYASMPGSIPDGLSNTIVFVERYMFCNST